MLHYFWQGLINTVQFACYLMGIFCAVYLMVRVFTMLVVWLILRNRPRP